MKLFTALAAFTMLASTAVAETRYATITQVTPNYQNIYQNVPRQQCENVEVPIYGNVQNNRNAGEGALAGMIIGGILGKGVTGDDGGAAAGAVIGGIIGADRAQNGSRRVITGYTTERQCREVMIREQVREIRNYTIRYRWNGINAQSYTYNRYSVGDRIPVTVSINAN
jgi:uncharacterized protein YcfJ